MKLTDFLKAGSILADFKAASKNEALEALCRKAADLTSLPYGDIFRVVWEREAMSSTGVGQGVALPHGKCALKEPVIVLARSFNGIDFDSVDGAPVRIFCLILSPASEEFQGHLKLLARLGRFFQAGENIEAIMAAKDSAAIHSLISERDVL